MHLRPQGSNRKTARNPYNHKPASSKTGPRHARDPASESDLYAAHAKLARPRKCNHYNHQLQAQQITP